MEDIPISDDKIEPKTITSFRDKYRFLSNFAPSKIEFEGIVYPTIEHGYQAAKTLDMSQRSHISKVATPGEAKKAGRTLTLRKDWEQIKEGVMYAMISTKFAEEPYKSQLLETSPAELEEGNYWHDNEWGNCQCSKCANIIGKNKLGKALMKLRDELSGR